MQPQFNPCFLPRNNRWRFWNAARIFSAKASGNATLSIQNATALLHDGKATPAETTSSPLFLEITSEGTVTPFPRAQDPDPPELFSPQIASDPDIFNGAHFLVFSTTDKGLGIDHFEVQEEPQTHSLKYVFRAVQWKNAESPYILEDQSLQNTIYVKAIDKAGNSRVVSIPPINGVSWYYNLFWIAFIVILIISGAVTGIRFIWNQYRNTQFPIE